MFFGGNGLKYNERRLSRALGLAMLVAILVGCSGEPQDQTVPDYAIAYVKRPIPTELDNNTNETVPVDPDLREATNFNAGGDVYLRERAAISAAERNITLCITDLDDDGIGTGDVRDLETSYDGTKLIFSLRLEDFSNGDDLPKWNLYEYDTEVGGCPVRVISDDFAAAKGDDVAPHYLPDGRIVYSSNAAVTTRESLLNEGKSQFSPFDEDLGEAAVVLHVMNSDGSNIKQISFNQSHDLDASVLSSGEIVFSRWDGAGNRSAMRLYTIRPDGTELKALYGLHDANVGTGGSTVQFMDPRELSDGRVQAMLMPFTGSAGGGAPVEINAADFTDINQPTVPNLGILSGPGQVLAIDQDVRTDGSISPAGRYRSVYPLGDGSNRALVSWSQCRLQPTDVAGLRDITQTPIPCPDTIAAGDVEAFPLYGIYVYDFTQDTQIPVVIPSEGLIIDEPVVLAPRPRPAVLIDKVVGFELDQALAEDEFVGILHIRSVYDFDGAFNALGGAATTLADMADPSITDADQRPARYLRIVKAAAIPDPRDDATEFDTGIAFGAGGRRGGMREIIGYATIEPDGSVMTKVPANVPLSIQVVDKDGRRISNRHLNWIQVRPGETLECGGCHTHTTTAPALPVPHGFSDAPTVLNVGADLTMPNGTSPWEFPGATTDNPATALVDETIFPQQGETMAQARIRVSCANVNAPNGFDTRYSVCPELNPSPNPVFFDDWSKATPIPDVLNLRYADLDPSMAAGIPVSAQCTPGTLPGAKWEFNCRTIINYEDSIHPLWSVPRTDAATNMQDYTCTVCHNNVDGAAAAMVPAAQLDLSDGLRQDNPDRFKSYQELLIQDDSQWQLVGGALVLVTQDVQARDPVTGELLFMDDGMGNQIPIMITINVPPAESPSVSVNGAVASSRFFSRFGVPGDLHEGLLSPAELRLLYEWLDIGAQYFNNSFDAPPP
jgi:Hydrazine synthase alpha subunit middle domain